MGIYREKWEKLLTNKRLGEEYPKKTGEDIRSDFQKDYDRIIFSNSFRRLGKKTQVHPLAKNDHIHSRLTHSLEVSSVGRSLGLKAGNLLRKKGDLPENYNESDIATIVQVASLAHDIGNPPFGHAGEYAIRHWFQSEGKKYLKPLNKEQKNDFRLFEGNAQGFRIVTQLEEKYMKGGMRLTYASLGTLVKYPWCSYSTKAIDKQKFNIFNSEKEIFKKIFEELSLKSCNHVYKRHPLSYLMEAADDICYGILDIEDAVELSIVSYDKAKDILCDIIKLEPNRKVKKTYCKELDKNLTKRRGIGKLRAKAINSLIELVFEEFENEYDCIVNGEYDGSLLDGIKRKNPEIKEIFKKIKKINQENIFAERRKIEIEIGAYEIISILLKNLSECVLLLERVKKIENLPFKYKRILDLMGEEHPTEKNSYYENLLKVTDYVSGMTDNYATYVANQFSGKFI
jgi:dGTPase